MQKTIKNPNIYTTKNKIYSMRVSIRIVILTAILLLLTTQAYAFDTWTMHQRDIRHISAVTDPQISNASSEIKLRWRYTIGLQVDSSPAIEDVDGDGNSDIITGSPYTLRFAETGLEASYYEEMDFTDLAPGFSCLFIFALRRK